MLSTSSAPRNDPSTSKESQPLLTCTETVQPKPHSKFPAELEGYIFILLSTFAYSFVEFFTHLSENKLLFPVSSTVFIRGIVQTIFSVTYFFLSKHALENAVTLSRQQQFLVTLYSFSFTLGYIFLLYGLCFLPIADCISISSIYPIITAFLAFVFLHESITRLNILAIFVSMCGVVLVTGTWPGVSVPSTISVFDRLIGSLFSFLSAFLFSVGYIIIRYLGDSVHYMVPVLCYGITLLISAPFLNKGIDFILFEQLRGTLTAILAAIAGSVAIITLTWGFQKCPAGFGSLILILEVPLSFVFGVFFFGEKLSVIRVSGSIMILGSAVIVVVQQVMLIRARSKRSSSNMINPV